MTSLMSEIAEPLCTEIAGHLSDELSMPVRFTVEAGFAERRGLLDRQEVDIAWICGLLYVQHFATPEPQYHPAVAPVMQGEGEAVYFGDIIVRHASPATGLADLRGATWAYNEETSFSGFQIMRAPLMELAEADLLFSRRIQSGSHLNSVALVRSGAADSAVIDSTVLQMAAARDPALLNELRVIQRIGPYPAPPITLSARLPRGLRFDLTATLLAMSATATGTAILSRHQVDALAVTDDHAYDDIRHLMGRTAGMAF